MKEVAIAIPSRLNSTRFPRKALYKINGIPLVVRVCQQSNAVLRRNHIYVVTPDQEIADVVRDYGFHACVDNREAFCGTHKLAQVADQIHYDNIVIVQGDEPIVKPRSIETIIDHKLNRPDELIQGWEWIDATDDKNVAKIVTNELGYVMYFSRHSIPHGAPTVKKPLGLYALHKSMLFDQQTRGVLEAYENTEPMQFLERGFRMYGVEVEGSHPIDVPADVEIVKGLL